MNLQLKSFSQDVDLSNPDKILYYLVFEAESGSVVRLPVQKETTEELIRLVYKKKIAQTEQPAEEPVSEEPETDSFEEPQDPFEEEEFEFDENGDPIEESASVFQDDPVDDAPESEDEVPSL